MTNDPAAPHEGPSLGLTAFFALACGALAANLYYAQPLVAPIAQSIGLDVSIESAIVTAAQVGYGLGLAALVPLGDVLENRRLILSTMAATILSLVGFAMAPNAATLFAMMLIVGLTSCAAQMLVPLAAHLAPPAARGRVVGNVMSGLLGGILLARPLSSFLSVQIGWRGVFLASAGLLLVVLASAVLLLPKRKPAAAHSYGELVASLGRLFLSEPVLRRRALYHAAMFAAFSLFWTGAPLILMRPPHEFTQTGIAFFALSGVLGVFAAPVAGRLADRGHSRRGTLTAMSCVVAGFALALAGPHSVAALVVAGILVDLGVQANLVIGQREIFQLDPTIRNRLNAVYMATFFAGGALGSALTSPALAHFGWTGLCLLGLGFPAVALLCALFGEGTVGAGRREAFSSRPD
ncbi:MFS transporter [Aureimonas endophytica]|uniref:MFS transporter n=1 Tax=Aureimonas endophytica TaxID=2027858 RepID=A0A916ZEK1_9HYPH|nr:MFS transporter [Aureimonas endophytica]GGD92168.1 MFS transporter [Aureimonas endophytica]